MADNQREEQEKLVEKMRNIAEKQEDRLHSLQANALKLANVYFVFQGIILAAIYSPTAHSCSQRWFPFSLSLVAGIFNLSALFKIGMEYVRTSSQQHKNRLDDKVERLTLNALATSPQLASSYNQNPAPDDSVERNEDCLTKAKYIIALICYMLYFLFLFSVQLCSVAGGFHVHGRDECRNLPIDESCINPCDGAINAKCVRVCWEY